jgi:hypothetical protein
MLIKKKISLLMIMVIERSYNLIITERYYFFSFRGKYEEEEGKFNRPRGIDFNSGNNIYVSKRNNYHIQKFESRGNFITQ